MHNYNKFVNESRAHVKLQVWVRSGDTYLARTFLSHASINFNLPVGNMRPS